VSALGLDELQVKRNKLVGDPVSVELVMVLELVLELVWGPAVRPSRS